LWFPAFISCSKIGKSKAISSGCAIFSWVDFGRLRSWLYLEYTWHYFQNAYIHDIALVEDEGGRQLFCSGRARTLTKKEKGWRMKLFPLHPLSFILSLPSFIFSHVSLPTLGLGYRSAVISSSILRESSSGPLGQYSKPTNLSYPVSAMLLKTFLKFISPVPGSCLPGTSARWK